MIKKSSLFTIFIFLVAISIITYLAFSIFSKRYSKDDNNLKEINKQENSQEDQKRSSYENGNPDEKVEENETNKNKDPLPLIPEEETTTKYNVTREDCLNQCTDFETEKTKEYCMQSCGFSSIENKPEEENDCIDREGVEKDYCLKELAITNEDFKTCEKISDKNIRKACVTRITENLLEKSVNAEK